MVGPSGGGAVRPRPARVAVGVGVVLVVVVVVAAIAAGRASNASTGGPAGAAAPASSATRSTTAPTTTAPTPPACDRRAELDAGPLDPPPAWASRVAAATTDPAWGDLQRSISVWVEGYGEIVAVEPDLALLPASNEKVLTAIGARLLLDPDSRFHTEVRRSGDHLVLVADGDPTLRSVGPHSLAALARQVRDAGITRVAGLQVDIARFEPATTARGWQDWQVPTYVGPMSALTVDDNRSRTDPAYLADPALGNGEGFATALRSAGVRVDGGVAHGRADLSAPVVAALDSATVSELSHDMLLRSDNEIAEALVREIGGGSTATGVARIADALAPWCLHLTGDAADGSGLSREDHRSAREWRRLLQAALEHPWADAVWAGLPVAGRTGTLSGRLAGAATVGNVRAKTGTIIGGSALSGYATTPDGRQVVFSVVVNGDPTASLRAISAIDRLVVAVTAG